MRLSAQLLRVFQRALEDEPGDRIDVNRRDLAAQAHGFQRVRSTARKGIEYARGTAAVSLADLLAEPFERLRILGLALAMQDAALGFLFDPLDSAAVRHPLL